MISAVTFVADLTTSPSKSCQGNIKTIENNTDMMSNLWMSFHLLGHSIKSKLEVWEVTTQILQTFCVNVHYKLIK